jgi:hypothetical protein
MVAGKGAEVGCMMEMEKGVEVKVHKEDAEKQH